MPNAITEVQFKFFDQLIVSAHIKAEISLLVDVHSHIIHKMKLCIIAVHTLFALVIMRLPGVIFQFSKHACIVIERS